MFAGIITDIGRLERISQLDGGRRIRVKTAWNIADLAVGASVAHSGVCLTVVAKGSNWFETEAWEEALRLTTLGQATVGDALNLERALRMGDELGGHMVSGHVDGKAKILSRTPAGAAARFVLEAPVDLAGFIAAKGSIALAGTALTVNAVDRQQFEVLLIDHSLKTTNWGSARSGDLVNLEVDQIARYAARLAQYGKA